MSRRRWLAIAAQAAAVAVLVALVYVSLLQPDEGGDLSGIHAPGGGRAQLPASQGEGERSDRRPGENPNDVGTTVPAGSFQGGAGAGAGAGGLGQGPEGPGPSGQLVNTPSDHQYGDAVGALLRRLGD